ncbi:MAG: hypothetical protein IT384_01610, partial [Deltaproteobacteria bacterium]|nr:hypothetical protein [Deltaproteobacteria bacterium]
MRSRLARLGSLSWMALLVACTGRSVSIDIVYPDPASYADNLKLNVIAIEPFAAGVDEMRDRVLVRCGALGVFPPTTKYPINSA